MNDENFEKPKRIWRKISSILFVFLLVAITVIVLLVMRKNTLSEDVLLLRTQNEQSQIIVDALQSEAERCNADVLAIGQGNFAEFEYCKKIVEFAE
jgi:flagellar biosynthesis/type III secretory pathway M-ring protein FliF/YscJ